jgi:toxin YoeB
MSYKLIFSDKAMMDACFHDKSGDKAILKKIKSLLAELEAHPGTGTGKPERLKHDRSGQWSRRINEEHRLTYRIDKKAGIVYVLEMKDHYK